MRKILTLLLALSLISSITLADDGQKYGGENRGKPLQPSQLNSKWLQECGSCHLAFPPGLLPAESWRRVMSGLDKHFGADASLTPDENREITAFLTTHPSNRWTANTAPLRITESNWFKSKHEGKQELPADVWKRPAIKSPANCQACHLDAGKSRFDEDRVSIPK